MGSCCLHGTYQCSDGEWKSSCHSPRVFIGSVTGKCCKEHSRWTHARLGKRFLKMTRKLKMQKPGRRSLRRGRFTRKGRGKKRGKRRGSAKFGNQSHLGRHAFGRGRRHCVSNVFKSSCPPEAQFTGRIQGECCIFGNFHCSQDVFKSR